MKEKRFYKIRMNCLNEILFVYFDYDNFKEDYIKDDYKKGDDTAGLSCGNGIWLDLEYSGLNGIIVHELSHYLDWLFDEEFKYSKMGESTEIRARLHEYLYNEVIKITKKNKQ